MSRYSPGYPLFRSAFHNLPVLLIIIALAGCTAQSGSIANRYHLVNGSQQRESSLGFSISPPSGHGWLEKLNRESLYYLKKTKTSDYSIYTKATEIYLDEASLEAGEFLQFVKGSKEVKAGGSNYKNISMTYAQDTELSPLCVRYSQKYEDHGNKNLRPDEFIKVRRNGLMCMHPDVPSYGVDMFYVESFVHSRASGHPSYSEEGEAFLGSLKFHPFDRKRG